MAKFIKIPVSGERFTGDRVVSASNLVAATVNTSSSLLLNFKGGETATVTLVGTSNARERYDMGVAIMDAAQSALAEGYTKGAVSVKFATGNTVSEITI